MRAKIWEDIPAFPGYQCTNDGRVRRGTNEIKTAGSTGRVVLKKILPAYQPPRWQEFDVSIDVLVAWTFSDQQIRKCTICGRHHNKAAHPREVWLLDSECLNSLTRRRPGSYRLKEETQ